MGKIEGKITNPTPPDYEKRRELERQHAFADRLVARAVKAAAGAQGARGGGGMATGDMPPPFMNRAARRARDSAEKRRSRKKSR